MEPAACFGGAAFDMVPWFLALCSEAGTWRRPAGGTADCDSRGQSVNLQDSAPAAPAAARGASDGLGLIILPVNWLELNKAAAHDGLCRFFSRHSATRCHCRIYVKISDYGDYSVVTP